MDQFFSFLTGGASGLLGTALSSVMGYFQEKQAHKNRLAEREFDLKEIRLEAENAERQQALNLEREQASADSKQLIASYKEASTLFSKGMSLTPAQGWVLVFVDFIRGLMRPALTIFYLYGTWAIWRELGPDNMGKPAEHAIIYLSTTCTLWWFGSRHIERQRDKMNEKK